MLIDILHHQKRFKAELNKPIDISIPLKPGTDNVNAWYCDPVRIEPVVMGDWIGDVNQGGSVNFRNVFLNPHGNGTHTECAGHISRENITLNSCLRNFFFIAELVTILPKQIGNGDLVIDVEHLKMFLEDKSPEALVIRTISNGPEKMVMQYSNTNPPYLTEEAMQYIHEKNILHLLIDLPSVDREKDDGKLASHHIFFQYPASTRLDRTITELIYVPNDVYDGDYLLNLMITSLENDASPSKPVLYKLLKA